MYRTATTLAAILTLSAALSAALADDPPVDVVRGEIDVRLGEIEVFVTDRQGNPVAGLIGDDFELLLDGQPAPITHFRAVASGGMAADATPDPLAPPTAVATGRHLVIYIDRGYLMLGDLRGLREELKRFLRQALAPGDRVMLVAAYPSLEVKQGFTSLPELIASQLDDIKIVAGGGRLNTEYQRLLRDIQRIKSQGNDLAARNTNHLARSLLSQAESFAAEVSAEYCRTTSQLQRLIGSLAGIDGRKVVIYVGGRVPASMTRSLFEAWENAFGSSSDHQMPSRAAETAGENATGAQTLQPTIFESTAHLAAGVESEAERRIAAVEAVANANGVTVHTLDAAGLRGSAATFTTAGELSLPARGAAANRSMALNFNSLADGLSSLQGLATATGGRSLSRSRNFQSALANIASDLRTYYSIGFTPPAGKDGNSAFNVKVRLRQRSGKLKVRHRKSFLVKDRDRLAEERTLSALLLGTPENPLAIEITTGQPTPIDQKSLRLPVSVTVPLARLALVAEGRVHTGRLSIFVTSGGFDRLRPVAKAVVPVRIANQDLLTSLGRRVQYTFDLTLSTGPERIAVTVRDDFRPISSTAVASTATGGEDDAAAPGSEPPPR